MNNIKYVIDAIVRQPVKLILIIIQISIATIVLLSGLNITLETVDTVNRAANLYNGKEVYRLLDRTNKNKLKEIDSNADANNSKYEFYKYLTENKDFNICAKWQSNLLIKDFCDKDKFIYDMEKKHVVDPYPNSEGNFINVKGFYADYNYLNEFKFDLDCGRSFEKDDFIPNNEISIILGAGYKSIYKIGDEFSYFDYMNLKNKKMKVVGILKENTYVYDQGKICSIDNSVICPIEKIDKKYNNVDKIFPFWISQCLLVSNDNEEALKDILDESTKLKLYDYDLDSCQKEIKISLNELKKNSMTSILMSLVIFLFISFGIITVQLNRIKDKTSEFGIHLLCGASKKDIIIRNYITVAIYIGVGMLIGAYMYLLQNKVVKDIRLAIICAVIYVLLVLIISYFPSRKINKMQITSFIRGLRE